MPCLVGLQDLQPIWHMGDAIPDDYPRNHRLKRPQTNIVGKGIFLQPRFAFIFSNDEENIV